jgi:hypothetical protein
MEINRRLERFHSGCRPKRKTFSWFSPKENHTSRSLYGHGNCETTLAGFTLVSASPGALPRSQSQRAGMRSIMLCLAVAASAALALAQAKPIAANPPDRLPDTYLIYSMLMPGQVFTDMDSGQNQPWAISDTTVNEDDMDPKLAPEAVLQPPTDNPRDFREAVGDYNQRKKERLVLKRRFDLDRTYVLLPAADATQFRASRTDPEASSDMQAAYGGYLGITYFSEVYFNIAQTAALVYILDWCGNLCSQADWVYLEKQNGIWVRRSGKAPAQT